MEARTRIRKKRRSVLRFGQAYGSDVLQDLSNYHVESRVAQVLSSSIYTGCGKKTNTHLSSISYKEITS
jgi:hypothetical protein